MKRRVAVFANGWGTEYLREVVTGAFEVARDAATDIFVFVSFSSYSGQDNINNSESNIFRLPDLRDYDGVILLSNSFNTQEELDTVYRTVMESGIPSVSLEYDYEGIRTINADNYNGMHDLVDHMIREHAARHIVFVGGPREHMESNTRLQAVRDAVRENGLSLCDEDIMYGDWAKNLAVSLVSDWLDRHEQLPDVFICANDIMAMGVCDLMAGRGYRVPEDVIVTGYDCTMQGQEYVPSLASVDHEWRGMGIKALQILLEDMAGRVSDASITMNARFVPGKSCGCDSNSPVIRAGRSYHAPMTDSLLWDAHFRHIYLAIRKAENADSLNQCLNALFQNECWMEGDNFMLCLEREFFNIEDGDGNLRTHGYSDSIDVICSLRDGTPMPHRIMKRGDAMFCASNENPEPGIYIFVPVYSEARSYGFAMLTKDIDVVEDNGLYIWTRHLSENLEQVRRNITIADLTRKLTKLSVTDVLTGVYNRAGCEKISYPMLEEWHGAGGTGAIMIADIDRMKTINDQYGHASGDLALRVVAMVLKSQLPSDWIVSRFGGDEFFVGGKLMEGMDMDALRESIGQKLAQEVERRQITFHLSLSIGYAVLEPDQKLDLEESLRQADRLMYTVKNRHHMEIDNE
ncbi:MAG: GGDEF domain-containing protein [bacterium]|nr:GGDEF domain-containing protein [bacterium]MCM1376542.1 GGDEF domain-containing protein [Muribaculum sp.]